MKVSCSNCGQHLEVPSEYQDHTIECPTCKKSMALQSSEQPATQTPASASQGSNRSILILVLGILSIVIVLPNMFCMFFAPFLPLALGCGIAAWIMGKKEIAKIEMGQTDIRARGLTKAGMICGIIGTITSAFCGVLVIIIILFNGFAIFQNLAATRPSVSFLADSNPLTKG